LSFVHDGNTIQECGVGTVNFGRSPHTVSFFVNGSPREFVNAEFEKGVFFNGEKVTFDNASEVLAVLFKKGGDNPTTLINDIGERANLNFLDSRKSTDYIKFTISGSFVGYCIINKISDTEIYQTLFLAGDIATRHYMKNRTKETWFWSHWQIKGEWYQISKKDFHNKKQLKIPRIAIFMRNHLRLSVFRKKNGRIARFGAKGSINKKAKEKQGVAINFVENNDSLISTRFSRLLFNGSRLPLLSELRSDFYLIRKNDHPGLPQRAFVGSFGKKTKRKQNLQQLPTPYGQDYTLYVGLERDGVPVSNLVQIFIRRPTIETIERLRVI